MILLFICMKALALVDGPSKKYVARWDYEIERAERNGKPVNRSVLDACMRLSDCLGAGFIVTKNECKIENIQYVHAEGADPIYGLLYACINAKEKEKDRFYDYTDTKDFLECIGVKK